MLLLFRLAATPFLTIATTFNVLGQGFGLGGQYFILATATGIRRLVFEDGIDKFERGDLGRSRGVPPGQAETGRMVRRARGKAARRVVVMVDLRDNPNGVLGNGQFAFFAFAPAALGVLFVCLFVFCARVSERKLQPTNHGKHAGEQARKLVVLTSTL